jgi:two-component system KDP operon response regulator KdpE
MDVLIIENDLEDSYFISGLFSENLPVFNIITDTGLNCLEIIKKNKPQLIVLSLNIPDMDSIHLIEQIRTISDVPLIALSIKGCPEIINALEAGASICMKKPVNHREFIARVGVLMRGVNHD